METQIQPELSPSGRKTADDKNRIRILVVEDERKLAHFMKARLLENDFDVDVVGDGEQALQRVLQKDYQLIILDLILPKKDGREVLSELRRSGFMTPVLILTARSSLEDKLEGFSIGADDYLTKPFAFAELLARIHSLLRRANVEGGQLLRCGDLVLNPIQRKAIRAGKIIDLTDREFALLEFLLRNKNRIVTRRSILEQVWGYKFQTMSNILDVYMTYLRSKVDNGFPKKLIHTARAIGFIIKES
ncbi:MAG: response regulator transcription factor [Bacteroidota bacterium]